MRVGWQLVIAMSDRGQQLAASASNRFCYTLDHHSNRAICRYALPRPHTPALSNLARAVYLQVDDR